MKALDGTTPFEAATGKKPNMQFVREWGEKVWVWLEKGMKLGGRVKEGRWIGVESKGFQIYWPDTHKSVECNVSHAKGAGLADRLEGENWDLIQDENDPPLPNTTDKPPQPPAPSVNAPLVPNEP